ncbi:polysaccharide pyruvyl transferase family protein, partial [Acinetobacter baumannii]|uniref:polysaccharide pyruvyl transferase family protein n=1 Tax=Acinetobacter baumannii TaxID=470 RepID=UPI00036BAF20
IKECLKALIDNTLKPLINSDYVLWDLPYHINMGDILIWQGELDFLSNLPYNMLDFGSSQTVNFPKLSKETTILLHGGGNFGDIYRSSQLFRNEVIKRYPENKIIILPQTVYYKNDSILKEDMNIMSKHSNLYVCVRDSYSKNLLSIYLDNKRIFLLPDMAFCMDDHYFSNNKGLGKVLYMKRLDAEFKANGTSLDIKYDLMSDWT